MTFLAKLRAMYSCLRVIGFFVSCLLMIPLSSLVHAQPSETVTDYGMEPHEAAEVLVVEDLCKGLPKNNAMDLARIGYETDAGLICVVKLIDALAVERIVGDAGIVSASDGLWRLVDRAIIRKTRRAAIRGVLDKIRLQLDHPLRSEAWLGLRVLDKEDGTVHRVGSVIKYMPIPMTHKVGLSLMGGPAELKQRLERSHPLHQEALLWAVSEMARERIERGSGSLVFASTLGAFVAPSLLLQSDASDSSNLGRTIELAGVLGDFSLTSGASLEAFVDQLFTEGYGLLAPPDVDRTVSGSDEIPPVTFHLKGNICTDGGRCQKVDTTVTSATNLLYLQTTPKNHTISQAQIHVPYLMSGASPQGGLGSYGGYIASYIGGGRWEDRSVIGNVLLDGGDTTASVSYSLEGDIVIPSCTNPPACTIQVQIVSSVSSSNNLVKTVASLELIAPTGTIKLPSTDTWSTQTIDRSLGEHIIKVRLSRDDTHSGVCCTDWRSHSFAIHIINPTQFAVNESYLPSRLKPAQKPTWIDQRIEERLKAFEKIRAMMISARINGENAMPIPFGNVLALSDNTYGTRFADIWSRALFARLALAWSNKDLKPTEVNELTALRLAVSANARKWLLPALQAELEGWSFAYSVLDPTPIKLVLAALVRHGDLTKLLDDAEIRILASQAKTANTEIGKVLNRAKEAIDKVRAGQSRVDAMLILMTLEEDLLRKGREAASHRDGLLREIAQLQGGLNP